MSNLKEKFEKTVRKASKFLPQGKAPRVAYLMHVPHLNKLVVRFDKKTNIVLNPDGTYEFVDGQWMQDTQMQQNWIRSGVPVYGVWVYDAPDVHPCWCSSSDGVTIFETTDIEEAHKRKMELEEEFGWKAKYLVSTIRRERKNEPQSDCQ